jgi:hypothetical protein
MGEDTSQRVQA